MEVPELFATAVPEEQLESGWDRAQALRRLFGPSQCLRSVESPSGVGSLPAIVQGRMQEQGTLLRQLKNFSAASKDLVRARELSTAGSPEAREAQRQLVLTYNDCAVHCYALGQLDEAVKLLGEALQNERTEQGLYANRGDCFFRLGELTYALADYQQALELRPGNRAVQGRVAAVLHEKGWQDLAARRFLQAEACFSMAIEHSPREALYYLCRAMAKRCLGKVESSREDVARSLWFSPTDSKILSLAHRLFPRKTVQAILRSFAQQTLDKTLKSPPRLPSDDTQWTETVGPHISSTPVKLSRAGSASACKV